MQLSVPAEIADILHAAARLAMGKGQYFIGVDHVFRVLVQQAHLLPAPVVDAYLPALRMAAREVERTAWPEPFSSPQGEPLTTPRCAGAANEALRLAQAQKKQPAPGHLLLALLKDDLASPSRAMDSLALPRQEIIARLAAELAKSRGAVPASEAASATPAPSGEETQAAAPVLERLTRDLTQAAREGALEAPSGRDREILQILQVLARKQKCNAVLVGEAGVGKTKVVEGLAVAIVRGDAPGMPPSTRVLELNIGALLAGTQYRGAFEEKLTGLLSELEAARDTVLFIDEFHLIMGAGATDGDAVDAANLLKPVLTTGRIKCIGATTLSEYRKFIQRDPALERRFQLVRIEPMSKLAAYEALKKVARGLARHHGVVISRKAVRAAIMLTDRHMPDRQLPDKAIDVLDEACARRRLRQESSGSAAPEITAQDVRGVLSEMLSIPIENLTGTERLVLTNLEERLRRRIVGQDEAVRTVAGAIRKSRAGLSDPRRPEAVLLFAGPTGVGKTQLAKELAELLYGSPRHLISFDMSEYSEPHSLSRLLGAPPGYVGSEEEGLLLAAVRDVPRCVLLFDEIEKAHPRIFDMLLPVLDEGRLKDRNGREVNFRQCIIILTSNAGAGKAGRGNSIEDRKALMEAMRREFRPEFINRIDSIVPFHTLLAEDVRAILAKQAEELAGRLRPKGMTLHVYQGAYEHLASQADYTVYGARELRRVFDQLVTTPLSAKIVNGALQPGDQVRAYMKDGEFVLRRASRHREPEEMLSTP